MLPAFTTSADKPAQLYAFTKNDWTEGNTRKPSSAITDFASFQKFTGDAGQVLVYPGINDQQTVVLVGLGDGSDKLAFAHASANLAVGDYEIVEAPQNWNLDWTIIGWADGAYRFDRYKTKPNEVPRLLLNTEAENSRALNIAESISWLRDLVNSPANEMGPSQIEDEITKLAEQFSAKLTVTRGDDLLAQFPLVFAVGKAASEEPRVLELEWGDDSLPELALIGKGVTFDTGGLDIKSAGGMRNMKKDMGGSAHALALAKLVMECELPVKLRLLVPAVENAVSAYSVRPGDIIRSAKGITVEIENTDAEGRLILADVLHLASQRSPDLIVDFATLTGAARIALGADLAPFYTDDEDLAQQIQKSSKSIGDPVWRMPLWKPYTELLKSNVADTANSGPHLAGSITAALFLEKFVETKSWVHFDIWAWRGKKYGRPEGGAACGLRVVWEMLKERYRR